ncbi:MAG: hypothetical protein HY862_03675 [Chloroflexi bacterium]|nr:hypothetical protein [Chloroflexota bacterium]
MTLIQPKRTLIVLGRFPQPASAEPKRYFDDLYLATLEQIGQTFDACHAFNPAAPIITSNFMATCVCCGGPINCGKACHWLTTGIALHYSPLDCLEHQQAMIWIKAYREKRQAAQAQENIYRRIRHFANVQLGTDEYTGLLAMFPALPAHVPSSLEAKPVEIPDDPTPVVENSHAPVVNDNPVPAAVTPTTAVAPFPADQPAPTSAQLLELLKAMSVGQQNALRQGHDAYTKRRTAFFLKMPTTKAEAEALCPLYLTNVAPGQYRITELGLNVYRAHLHRPIVDSNAGTKPHTYHGTTLGRNFRLRDMWEAKLPANGVREMAQGS